MLLVKKLIDYQQENKFLSSEKQIFSVDNNKFATNKKINLLLVRRQTSLLEKDKFVLFIITKLVTSKKINLLLTIKCVISKKFVMLIIINLLLTKYIFDINKKTKLVC